MLFNNVIEEDENYIEPLESEEVKKIKTYAGTPEEIMKISKRFIDLDTGEEQYTLTYNRKGLKRIENIKIKPDDLEQNSIKRLANKGLNVNDVNKSDVMQKLLGSVSEAEICYVSSKYGFKEIEENLCFLGSEFISKEKFEDEYLIKEEKIDISPIGSMESWLEMYNTEVKGNPYLETSVALGLSAPVLNLLNEKYPDLKSLMIHIAGDSTTGKSTASMLAISVAGNPNTTSRKSLFKRWNATKNAILAILEGINSFPIVFDELSTNSNTELTDLIYAITEGVGKSRSNKYGELQEHGIWNTVIISNGESSIFNRLNDNTGLKVRVFEFFNKTWTTSASQSEKIKEISSKNYGHISNILVKYIVDIGKTKVEEIFEEEERMLKEKFPNSRLKDRIAKKLAVITTTVRLINDSKILEMNYDSIVEVLREQEEDSLENREVSEIALDKLFQYLVANAYLLKTKGNHRIIGRLNKNGVFLIREELNSILSYLKFEDPKSIIHNWEKKGYIYRAESDRAQARTTINSKRVVGYTLIIPEEYKSLINISKGEENYEYNEL